MSQEYTEEKTTQLTKLSSKHRLREALLILVVLCGIGLLVALLSFDPADPSWSQTAWHEPVHNLAGMPGAWLADMLFFIFGVVAYSIPLIITAGCWLAYRRRSTEEYIDYFALALRLIGALALIATSCGLAAISADDIWYFASGGVIGSLLSATLLPMLHDSGSTLALLFIWAAGLTLFTGWSWVSIAEKTGSLTLTILTFASNRSRRDGRGHDDEEPYQVAFPDEEPLVSEGVTPAEDEQGDRLWKGGLVSGSGAAVTGEAESVPKPPLQAIPVLSVAQWQSVPGLQTSDPVIAPSTDGYPQRSDPLMVTAAPPVKETEVKSIHASPWGQPVAQTKTESMSEAASSVSAPESDTQRPGVGEALACSGGIADLAGASPSGLAARSQVKEGIGPKLPPANRVRIPTRRELASYGIKLPSRRLAQECDSEAPPSPPPQASQQDYDALNQQQLARQFAESQRQRYGDDYHYDAPDDHETEGEPECAVPPPHEHRAQPESAPSARADVASSPSGARSDQRRSGSLFTPALQASSVQLSAAPPRQDQPPQSLLHPLLMRNGDNRPRQKPATPLPSLDLLTSPPQQAEPVDAFALEQMARLVEARLADFRIKADVVSYSPGPVITRFELNLAPGVKAARISSLSRDLARSLSTVAVRVVEVIPGKPYVGLELPNKKRQTVYLRDVLDCAKFAASPSPLAVVLGKDIAGDPVIADLAKMPHLLVAGTTGSGKSVGVNAMILSMLYKAQPEEVRFIMIDPKMLELSVYEGIPHLLTEVVTDMKDAANALRWSVNEMERRYKLMSALGVRNLAGYNEKIDEAARMARPIPDPYWKPGDSMETQHPVLEKLPYIVVVVDEFADLMMSVGKKVEELIARLAQKARAAGIHLVLATQRPSVDVITGLIKANIPTRVAFTVSSKIDSRTILDQGGAESLLGMGDMLYCAPNSSTPVRVHGAFVRDEEVHAVVQDWKARGQPQYVDGITSDSNDEGTGGYDGGEELDPLFDQAVSFVTGKRKASISGVQRQFRIGYNRAARIIEQMENQGIVTPQGHNGNREVLAPPPFE